MEPNELLAIKTLISDKYREGYELEVRFGIFRPPKRFVPKMSKEDSDKIFNKKELYKSSSC